MARKFSKYDVEVPEDFARSYQPKYVALHLDRAAVFEDTSDEVAATLIRAVLSYARTKEVPALEGIAKTFFSVLKPDLDADLERAAKLAFSAEYRRTRGGNIRGEGGSIEDRSIEDRNIEVGNIEERKEKEEERRDSGATPARAREEDSLSFIPPDIGLVKAYFKAEQLSGDAESFYFYYSAKDWKIGKVKMRDWQAAARSWSKKEDAFKKKEKPKDYRSELPFTNEDYGTSTI